MTLGNLNVDRLATYDLKTAHTHIVQLKKEVYPEINKYLTSLDTPECRGIKKETLEAFKVGVGREKFRND